MKTAAHAAVAQRLLNDREGAAYLNVSRSQFRELVASGAIPRVRVPSGDGDGLNAATAAR